MFDYLVVGAGLFGSTVAYIAKKNKKSVLVLDKRPYLAGNIYTKEVNGIQVHKYGAHIFHTDSIEAWKFINQFAFFNNYVHSPVANYKGVLYSLPFNMWTFNQIYGVRSPKEAKEAVEKEKKAFNISTISNLEEQAISLIGSTIYEKLIKGYTQKQWGRPCQALPPFIINRLPVRYTYNNNYFNSLYQGIPCGGYTSIIKKMLEGITVLLNTNYLDNKKEFNSASTIIYTGAIDEYFNYALGALEYRSVRFEEEALDIENYQGVAVVNYTDMDTPYTRIIEHKHFENTTTPSTIISKEYSTEWRPGVEPYYPINDSKNNALYEEYKKVAKREKNVHFCGRLGEYKYYDMDKTIIQALALCKSLGLKI